MKIIFLGSQGSGKSTQAKMLAEKRDVPYIEMGQILRDKSKGSETEFAEIKQALETGNLVPDNITVNALHERTKKSDCEKGYILDGYPRNYAQLEGLPKDIDKVFYIKVSDQEAINRLLSRAREDDSLEVITRRLEIYHKETEPLLLYFKQQGILQEIDGERPIEVIHEELSKLAA